MSKELYIGLMSGTSADGLDAALVAFDGDAPQLKKTLKLPFSAEIRRTMVRLRSSGEDEISRLGWLDAVLGELCAEAVLQLQAAVGEDEAVAAVGWAGHTVRHCPDADPPFTLQAGDPAVICQRSGLPVVCEFRRSDMAAGGQGAPLAPLFHNAFFGGDEDRVVANLGGIANISVLSAHQSQPVRGFDTGPANCLLDEWAQRHLGQPLDEDGSWARSGTPSPKLLRAMLAEPWFARPPPKSTGRELFNLSWLDAILAATKSPSPADVQATLALLTARTLVQHLKLHCPNARRLILSGGGAANGRLVEYIAAELAAAELAMPVDSTEAHGLDASWIEAVGIAWLARCRVQRQMLDMAAVTGGQRILLGALLQPN